MDQQEGQRDTVTAILLTGNTLAGYPAVHYNQAESSPAITTGMVEMADRNL